MIAHSVTLPTLVTLLKQLYVEVARDSFTLDGRPPTDSRISMLTGVHRKDVRTLRETGMPATAPPALGISFTVVGRWLGDPRFVDEGGRPRRLSRTGEGSSFSQLVASVSADVRPRTVLDELARQDFVMVDEVADEVVLLVDAFVPQGRDPAVLDVMAQNLHDHGAAAIDNLLAPAGQAPFLERAVYYNGLTEESVQMVEAMARAAALEALARLNSEALARQRADQGRAGAVRRFRFGAYFYTEGLAPSVEGGASQRNRSGKCKT